MLHKNVIAVKSLQELLENINNDEWIEIKSPLMWSLQIPQEKIRKPAKMLPTGVEEIDYLIRETYKKWSSSAGSPVQNTMWESVTRLVADEAPALLRAILILTYFYEPKMNADQIAKKIAIARASYYRWLGKAIYYLHNFLIENLTPAIHLETPPKAISLTGRKSILDESWLSLAAGKAVCFTGGSGVGKTIMGANLVKLWKSQSTTQLNPVFWYTFHAKINDDTESLLYALGLFFRQAGQPDLWNYLMADPSTLSVNKALAILRRNFFNFSSSPVLLCFDEIDTLLLKENQEAQEIAKLHSFFSEMLQTERYGSAVLMMGQRNFIEPSLTHHVILKEFDSDELRLYLSEQGIQLNENVQKHLLLYTKSNPLLLKLFVTLYRQGAIKEEQIRQLSNHISLDWMLVRIRKHLSSKEYGLLCDLAIYEENISANWIGKSSAQNALRQLGLLEIHGDEPQLEYLQVHHAIKQAIREQMTQEQRLISHLHAAQTYEEHSLFTPAAYHYVLAQRPDYAIQLWRLYQEVELKQGRTNSALKIFQRIQASDITDTKDAKTLALILGELYARTGQAIQGLDAINNPDTQWTRGTQTSEQAHKIRAKLYTLQGKIDLAVKELRTNIEELKTFDAIRLVHTHVGIGRRLLSYERDIEGAAKEILRAKLELELFQGALQEEVGVYVGARTHFLDALRAAEKLNEPAAKARIYELLGILESHNVNLSAAQRYLQKAEKSYLDYGNLVCGIGTINTNRSYMYLLSRQYTDAIAPGEIALKFAEDNHIPNLAALNHANLSEAHDYLDQLDQAEYHANAGIRYEEISARPYCLYTLGHIRAKQGAFSEAITLCQEAINTAAQNMDNWALAAAQRTLGFVYLNADKRPEARAAFEETLQTLIKLNVVKEVKIIQDLIQNLSKSG